MEDILKLQCFICKQTISKENPLDPCSVMISSNADQAEFDQRSQTFFCHFNCFKHVHHDDSTLYLESLETPREVNERNQVISQNLADFSQLLYENKDQFAIWKRLLASAPGKWLLLKDLLKPNHQLLNQLKGIENKLGEPLIITWTDDMSSSQRAKKSDWKVIIIATESHYEFPITFLIDFDKEN